MKIKNQVKKMHIITLLVICFCVMAVGYAILTQNLNIDGTAKVTGIWDVEFTNITSTKKGGALDKETPIYNKTTVTFNTTLNEPGDKMIYTITVTNNGNIDAIIESINLSDSLNNDIIYSYNGIAIGNVLKAKGTHKFNVIVEFNKSATNITKATESTTLTVNYVQKFGSSITETEINSTVFSAHGIDIPIATSGDGLYVDEYEPGRYIFKGANPSNNITFNNEKWNIVSFEPDNTVKIIKSSNIGNKTWDNENSRDSTVDTYCIHSSEWGCNAWAKTTNLLDINDSVPLEFVEYHPNGNSSNYTSIVSGIVTKDCSLNTYLNETYYNTMGSDKKYIIFHKFNVGAPGFTTDTESIALNAEQEKKYTWIGKIGLITVTDYMRATISTTCTSLSKGYLGNNSNGKNCGTNNWLKRNYEYWTLSADAGDSNALIWMIKSNGSIDNRSGHNIFGVAPVVYLDSTILLSGDGNQERYQITGQIEN